MVQSTVAKRISLRSYEIKFWTIDNWRRAEARADHIRLIRWPKLQQAHLCSCSFSEFGKKLHTRRAPRSKEIYKPGRRVTSETSRSSSKTLWYGEDERLKDIRTCLCPTIKLMILMNNHLITFRLIIRVPYILRGCVWGFVRRRVRNENFLMNAKCTEIVFFSENHSP